MKTTAILISGIAALFTPIAQADTVVHFTGSTAFRAATVTAIQNLMGGTGNFKAAYQSTSGSATTTSNQCIIQGTIPGLPSGANPVTIKCSWSGSTGGIKTVVENIDVTTWMSVANLPGTNTSVGLGGSGQAAISYALDTTQFPGETAKADVTMEDSAQASTGFTSTSLVETRVGVIAFEWVAGNTGTGTASPITNITPLLAQAVLSGGAPLSQFTGVRGDASTYVYGVGRNFDSGTRLSCLAESGVGVFGGVQHVQATVSGSAGATGSQITSMKLYSAETVLGQSFGIGQSGYASGSFVSDLLATPGSLTANTTTGIAANEQLLFGAGHLIGYVGRNDAVRATRTTNIAGNNAHRLTWNGLKIWNDPVASNGVPASYNDHLITEGLYPLWEYQNLAYRSTFSGNGKAVADAVAQRIIDFDATTSGTKLSDMHVSKAVEGGIITAL